MWYLFPLLLSISLASDITIQYNGYAANVIVEDTGSLEINYTIHSTGPVVTCVINRDQYWSYSHDRGKTWRPPITDSCTRFSVSKVDVQCEFITKDRMSLYFIIENLATVPGRAVNVSYTISHRPAPVTSMTLDYFIVGIAFVLVLNLTIWFILMVKQDNRAYKS